MSGGEVAPAPGVGGSNASEFVRKLYRMLEDPAHQDVARWGKDGDTFVVVENEKFTRSILPKHFKHSNMASFVRQLNKYDFHKVRQTNDSSSSSNGANTLEFKHPNFRVGSKDDLDNIRRKAPAPRRTQATEDFTTTHHISVLTDQLTATQQQVQQLQELFTDVSQTNRLLVNEVLTLQKMLNAQKQSQHEMLNFMSGDRNRHQQSMHLGVGASSMDGEEAAPELRRARELLSSVTPDSIADRELERLQGVYGSPADSAVVIPQASMPMMHDPMNDINRYPVYPVGQTVGIDPFHSDHIHKIPYAIPNDASTSNAMPDPPAPQPINITNTTQQNTSSNNGTLQWGARKPRIFLVEDDPTCSKIGIKFLKSMGCEVEHAQNGAEAYSRITSVGRDHFDMIFMDIIMPRLDGVSTTMYIRQDCPSIPIVAMTSNIRSDEVHCYFEHGMNGVLAKPFTKSGMQKIVENHLGYLLKNYDPSTQQESGSGYVVGGGGYLNPPGSMSTTATTFKFETTPTPPATGSTWSPGQMPQASPMNNGMDQNFGMVNGNNQYGMAPNSATRATFPGGISQGQPSSGRMDNQSPPEKRQRTYA